MPQVAEKTEIIATRAEYVEAARSFLGVRWQHQGRSEQGIDCVGLLVVPACRLGLLRPEDDVTNYSRQPDGEELSILLHRYCLRLPRWQDAREGDVLAIKYADQPQHVAIVTRPHDARWGIHIIHAAGSAEVGGKVVEHRIDKQWLASHRARIHAAFAIRGLG